MPLLSIIIPVYNVENYLRECLDSILNQDIYDYEVILVNDASTDGSGIICEEYAEKNSNFKYIHLKKNALLGNARNIGLLNATGEYVQFCDSDDYYIDNSLKVLFEELNNNSCDVIVGHFICKPEKGAFVSNDMNFNIKNQKKMKVDDFLNYYIDNQIVMALVWRFIIRRDFLIKNKLYFIEGYFAEDVEWLPRVLCFTDRLYEIKDPFYCYRPRASGSITSRKTYLHAKSYLQVAINLIKFLDMGKYKDTKNVFIKSQINSALGIFASYCDTFDSFKIKELSDMIKINIDELKTYNHDFIKYINMYGALDGLILYRSELIKETLELILGNEYKDIYIFPTGHNGEATLRILKNEGYGIKGFLDNSKSKEGSEIDGVVVSRPSILKELNIEELGNSFFIISTQKKQVAGLLFNQLMGFGIKEEQIISRIY